MIQLHLKSKRIALKLFPAAALLAFSAFAQQPFQIRVVVLSDQYIQPVQALLQEWYPKINAILYGPSFPLPYPEVKVSFEPTIFSGAGAQRVVVPAFALDNIIHVNEDYMTRIPDDYHAMLIHELTHINQHHKDAPNAKWLIEGIADYVRHKYYQKDIVPRLVLDANGNLKGDEANRSSHPFQVEGYRDGYTVTGAFLYWVELAKDKDIVATVNRALHDGNYSDDIFQRRCGAPLGSLWHEFLVQSVR